MSYTSIPSSQIAKYNRMDADFHIALIAVADRVQVLEASNVKLTIIDKLLSLDTEHLHYLDPLVTGSQGKNTREHYLKAIKTYPYIAYALIESKLDEIEQLEANKVTTAEAKLEKVRSIKKLGV